MYDNFGGFIKQSSVEQDLIFFMQDSTDTPPVFTGKTGLTPTVTISKDGAAFGAPAGAVTELAQGYYKVAANATDTATLGNLILKATSAGAINCYKRWQVILNSMEDGIVKVSSGTGANQISLTSGVVNSVGTVASVTAGVIVTTNNDKTNYALSAAGLTAIAGAVWNALTSAHVTAGTFGLKVGSLTDPWDVALPGAYVAGKAGYIVGTNLNTTVSSRSSLDSTAVTAAVDTALDAAQVELASIPAATASLRSMIKFAFEYFRNKRIVVNNLETLYKDNGSTALGTAAVSNDGTTFTKGKMS